MTSPLSSSLPPSGPPPPPARFDAMRERVGQALVGIADALIHAVSADLEQAAGRARDPRDRMALFDAGAQLEREADARTARVPAALKVQVAACLASGRTAVAGAAHAQPTEALEVDARIVVDDVARGIRDGGGDVYATYVARIAALLGRGAFDEAGHPLGASVLAAAVMAAFTGVVDSPAVRAVLRRALVPRLAPRLVALVDDLDHELAQAGVDPFEPAQLSGIEGPALDAGEAEVALPGDEGAAGDDIVAGAEGVADGGGVNDGEGAALPPLPERFAAAVQGAGDAQPSPAEPTATRDDANERLQQQLAEAAGAAETLGRAALAGDGGRRRMPLLPTLQPVVELERNAIAFAHSLGIVPYGREARARFFGNVRARVRQAGGSDGQVAGVDLVAALFDYVVDETRLPESVKPLMWRLQQPAVALALLDAGYLGDDPRSLRRLVENVGAIATAFADELSRGSELHRRLETVVRAVEIVASALQTRSSVMARQIDLEYRRASGSVAQLIERLVRERVALESTPGRRNRRDHSRRPDRLREQQVTERLHRLLDERLQGYEVPESVREFVQTVWLRHLRTAALRDGEESAEFRLALQVVDDLLWSLDGGAASGGPRPRQSRRVLAQKIPPMIRLLTQGIRESGGREDDYKPFFDELFLVHLRKMQRRGRGDGSAATTVVGAGGVGDGRPARQDNGIATPTVPVLVDPISLAELPSSGAGVDEPAQAPEASVESSPAPVPADEPEEPAGIADAAPAAAPAPEPEFEPGSDPSGFEAVSPDPGTEPAAPGTAAGDFAPEQRLLEVLASLDLGDWPIEAVRVDLPAQEAIGRVQRGVWLELIGRDGAATMAKVAWINSRRTVVLLVRRPDRKAQSLRFADLQQRFATQRAFVIGSRG